MFASCPYMSNSPKHQEGVMQGGPIQGGPRQPLPPPAGGPPRPPGAPMPGPQPHPQPAAPGGLNHPQWGSGGQGNMGQFQPMQMFNNLNTALQPYLQNPGLQQAIGQSPIGPYAQQLQGLPFIGSLFGRQG